MNTGCHHKKNSCSAGFNWFDGPPLIWAYDWRLHPRLPNRKAGLPSTSHSGQSGHSLTSCSSLSEGNCGNHGNLTILINDSLTMWRQQWDRGGCTQDKVMQAEVCQHAGSWAYLKIKWGNLKIKWGRPHKQGMEQVVPLQGVPTSQLWPSVHVTVHLSTAPNTT